MSRDDQRLRDLQQELQQELDELKELVQPGHDHDSFLWGMLASKSEITIFDGTVVLSINLDGQSHRFEKDSMDPTVRPSVKRAICQAMAHVIYMNKLHLEDFNKIQSFVTIP